MSTRDPITTQNTVPYCTLCSVSDSEPVGLSASHSQHRFVFHPYSQ
jgi:hypothetical protein